RAALRAVTGSENTDQRNRLGSFLSASAVKTCVPSGRSLGAMVIGTSNCGLKFSRTYSLESLRLTNTAICPGRRGGSALAALSAPGRRAASFLASGATAAAGAATALAGSAGLSTALVSSALGPSILDGPTLAAAAEGASVFACSGVVSTFASPADGAGAIASSTFLPSVATVLVDLTSTAAASAAGLAGSDFGASDFASALGVSLTGWTLVADGVASDMVMTPFVAGNAPRASAVWVCSRSAAACPTVDRSSRPVSELAFAGLVALPASAPLSLFTAGASVAGSLAMRGCGTTFCATSNGCVKLAGVIWPGVMMTRAPILVQFHIFTANAIGMRMQPCDAG